MKFFSGTQRCLWQTQTERRKEASMDSELNFHNPSSEDVVAFLVQMENEILELRHSLELVKAYIFQMESQKYHLDIIHQEF